MVVPSPEGGYPINLSYHAGIAMDQEVSWMGLGWNLNPGAINRSVNGFPDDYNGVKFHELFYDEYQEETNYNLSVGYGDPSNTASVGLNFSWGTNRSLGGSISYDIGFGYKGGGSLGLNGSFGTNGGSIGLGYTGPGGMSLGASVNNSGTVGGNFGLSKNNGGFSISANSGGGVGFSVKAKQGNSSLGLSFRISESGVGINASYNSSSKSAIQGAGAGVNFSFSNSIEQGDYVIDQSNSGFSIFVPTPIGTFSGSFGKQKTSWYLNNTKSNTVNGPLYFDEEIFNVYTVNWYIQTPSTEILIKSQNFDTYDSALSGAISQSPCSSNPTCIYRIVANSEAFMDVYEFPLGEETYASLDINNLIFPNYDNYNVQGQGISGNLALKHYENANLFGLSNKSNSEFNITFSIDGNESTASSDPVYRFDEKAHFYFENEYASYLGTQPVGFNYNMNHSEILDHHSSSNPDALPRRKTSSFIEYFTNEEVAAGGTLLYDRGYIHPKHTEDLVAVDPKAIRAFTVTGVDGRKYHYSIPVMNYVTVTRTIGAVKNEDLTPKNEDQSYFEKIQDEPYATHWLLTAVTGPDYIDVNNNHKVDSADYGYWVGFDYGKWSEAFGWKMPYGKDYLDSGDDEDVKTNYKGYKDIYYLDAIETRTHTAFFSKETRSDYNSYAWNYESIQWDSGAQTASDFQEVFNIPQQSSLSLKQIILLKNEDIPAGFDKSFGDIPGLNTGSVSIGFPSPQSQMVSREYNRENNVYTKEDIPYSMLQKAVKVVDLSYAWPTALASNTPNATIPNLGRLTLDRVNFKGKSNTAVLPPYEFTYYDLHDYDLDAVNSWGYHKDHTYNWSLQSIKTPEGGEITIEYESDDFEAPVIENSRLFTTGLEFVFGNYPNLIGHTNSNVDPELAPEAMISIRINIDEGDPAEIVDLRNYFSTGDTFYMDLWFSAIHNWNGNGYDRSSIDIKENQATITQIYQDHMFVNVMASSPLFNREFVHELASPVSDRHATPEIIIPNNPPILIQNPFKSNQRRGRYDMAWIDEEHNDNYRYSMQYRIIGNKEVYDPMSGDVRVKSLTTSDDMTSYTTKYYYNTPGSNTLQNHPDYQSSGSVSYIPNDDYAPIPYSAELPAPKVMYEHVTIENFDANGNAHGSTHYTFNVMKDKTPGQIKFGDFLEISTINSTTGVNSTANKEVDIKEVVVKDNLSAIGQLLKVENYNGIGQLLSRTENEYFSRDNRPSNQGMEQESFQTYKEIDYHRDTKLDKWIVSSATRINYSQALKSSTSLAGNQSTTTNFDIYDGISGETLETSTVNAKGTQIKNRIIPAFVKYPQMGSKVDNLTYKNMLSQSAVQYTLMEDNGQWKPIGVGITTWNNNWSYTSIDGNTYSVSLEKDKIWRKHMTYVWDGEINSKGIYHQYDYATDDGFNWTVPNIGQNAIQPAIWKRVSKIEQYDHFSVPLEVEDINGNRAVTKTTDNGTKVLMTCNAPYGEAFYTGAEHIDSGHNWLDQQINGSHLQTDIKSHTGTYSLAIGTSADFIIKLKANTYRTGTYKLSAWVHKDNQSNTRFVAPNGTTVPFNGEKIIAGNWVQLNHYHDIQGSSVEKDVKIVSNSGTIYVDDVRFHPIASSMASYVYNDYDELSFILGGNNMATKYQYDAAGRLIKTYEEMADTPTIKGGFKLAAQYFYNYKGEIYNGDDCPPIQTVEFDNIQPNDGDAQTFAQIEAPNGTNLQFELVTVPSGNGGTNFAEVEIDGHTYTAIQNPSFTYVKDFSFLPVAIRHSGTDTNGSARLTITSSSYVCPTVIGQSNVIEDRSFNAGVPIQGTLNVSTAVPAIGQCGDKNDGWTCLQWCWKYPLSLSGVTGGNGNYSYDWEYKFIYDNGNQTSWSNIPGAPDAPNVDFIQRSDSTAFCTTDGSPKGNFEFRCIVTDSIGNAATITWSGNDISSTCTCQF